MSSLENLLNSTLPLNRKERFYTGTVFPMIVCRDNFDNFHIFLEMIGCNCRPKLPYDQSNADLLIFTEYNLKQSIFGSAKIRFEDLPSFAHIPLSPSPPEHSLTAGEAG